VVYGAAAALDRFGATVSLSALALIIGGTIGILVMKGRRGTSKLGSNTCKVS
jgi:ABC-type amino acid transport system permease subunit